MRTSLIARHLFRFCTLGASATSLLMLLATGALAQDKQDSIDTDYGSELPRIKPLEPADALKKFEVAAGFKVELVAAEPLVTDPVAIAYDGSGNAFVAEMKDYSEHPDDATGLIRKLIDKNGDGVYDESSIYADKLSWPTAVLCYDGGIFVGAAPHIYYLKDVDGDGRAEKREIVFTGFQRNNVQGLINSFHWGIDQRIHGSASTNGGEIVTPPHPDRVAVNLRGRDFSFDPRNLELRSESGGGQHGMSFDVWGRKFLCSNSNHLQHARFDDRYLGRNPFYGAPGPALSIADDGPQADVFRISEVEPWRIVRTRLRMKGIVPGIVEGGGRSSGYFTSATGVTIYNGDQWPKSDEEVAIVGDVGSNIVHRKRLIPTANTFVGKRIDEKSELVRSSDIWFRPVQFANAPDGTLHILDMYREVIEHPASLHPIIKKHLDLDSGNDRGRIYRVVAMDLPVRTVENLEVKSDKELVGLLDHPNAWHRLTAGRLLFERKAIAAIPELIRFVETTESSVGKSSALYVLQSLGGLTPELLLKTSQTDSPDLLIHVLRNSEGLLGQSAALQDRVIELINHSDLRVQTQALFSAGDIDGVNRLAAIKRVAMGDVNDPVLQVAVLTGLKKNAADVLNVLLLEHPASNSDGVQQLIAALASQIGKQRSIDDVATLISTLQQLATKNPDRIPTLLESLQLPAGSPMEAQVLAALGEEGKERIRKMLNDSLVKAVKADESPESRAEAVLLLRLGKYEEFAKVASDLLSSAQPSLVQAAALDTLGRFQSAEGVGDLIMSKWDEFSPAMKTRAVDILLSEDRWTIAFLKGMESDKAHIADIGLSRLDRLTKSSNEEIAKSAAKLHKAAVERRAGVLDRYKQSLTLEGNINRGKEIFQKNCSQCHKMSGIGFEVGPNLATMKNRGPEAVLLNVLDPNREINPQYLAYVVETRDGLQVSGIVVAETATSVTLQKAEGMKETILRVDIESMRSTGISLMPEGIEQQVDEKAMADLIQFLMAAE